VLSLRIDLRLLITTFGIFKLVLHELQERISEGENRAHKKLKKSSRNQKKNDRRLYIFGRNCLVFEKYKEEKPVPILFDAITGILLKVALNTIYLT